MKGGEDRRERRGAGARKEELSRKTVSGISQQSSVAGGMRMGRRGDWYGIGRWSFLNLAMVAFGAAVCDAAPRRTIRWNSSGRNPAPYQRHQGKGRPGSDAADPSKSHEEGSSEKEVQEKRREGRLRQRRVLRGEERGKDTS